MRIPGSDAALRIGGLRAHDVGQQLRRHRHGRQVRHLLDPGRGDRGRPRGRRARPTRPSPAASTSTCARPRASAPCARSSRATSPGPGDAFRLRHAYGQWRKLTVGQTWSTFSDPEAEPDGIDREGLNAISLFRQAQFRWTQPLGERLALALAAENPAPDISAPDGSPVPGVNQVPDLVARLRWTPGEKTLVQGSWRLAQRPTARRRPRPAGVPPPSDPRRERSRRRRSRPWAGASTTAGASRSPWHADRDRILFALAGGWGIGRYITDLGDRWAARMPSTIPRRTPSRRSPSCRDTWATSTGGSPRCGRRPPGERSYVDNLDVQTGDALHRTDRATLNLSWSPIPRIDIVGEFLWGRRIDKDGRRGEARQLQLGTTFRF